MAVQAGYKPLNYQSWEQNKTQYIGYPCRFDSGLSTDETLGQHGLKKGLGKTKMRIFFARGFKTLQLWLRVALSRPRLMSQQNERCQRGKVWRMWPICCDSWHLPFIHLMVSVYQGSC
jgi:hypothetical protein